MRKLLPYVLIVCVILGLGYATYRHGYNHGSQKVRLLWEQDKATAQVAHTTLLELLARKGEEHRRKQQEIADELAQVRQTHEDALAQQRSSYEQRLLQSIRRATLYQRQAQAGAIAQRDLADHAARLDRALEEGIRLVEELAGTLGLRERQLILFSDQIRNDRQLLEGDAR